jgi:hypothetical protein
MEVRFLVFTDRIGAHTRRRRMLEYIGPEGLHIKVEEKVVSRCIGSSFDKDSEVLGAST